MKFWEAPTHWEFGLIWIGLTLLGVLVINFSLWLGEINFGVNMLALATLFWATISILWAWQRMKQERAQE